MCRRQIFRITLYIIGILAGVLIIVQSWLLPNMPDWAENALKTAGSAILVMAGGLASLNEGRQLIRWLWGKERDDRPPPLDLAQTSRNRAQLIQNVRVAWIQGVLDKSLHQSVWLELGMEPDPTQVDRPWPMVWQTGAGQQAGRPPHPHSSSL